jgi:hypothetical protein
MWLASPSLKAPQSSAVLNFMNAVFLKEFEPFLHKLGQRLQCPGKKSQTLNAKRLVHL